MSLPVRPVSPLRASDPRRLGGHTLLGRLGAGGMGVVYLAEGPSGRVAIKVVRDELSNDAGFRARFQREVRACFLVSGPWTARLVDFDVAADPPWLATEFLDAPDLQEVVDNRGAFTPAGQLSLAYDLARGLASLHARTLVHRDLKPSNVLSAPEGLKIIDFGIASAVEDIGSLTATANVVGSPAWMAPEQILDGQSGTASDVYAWGALVAFAATGQPLVNGRNIHQIMSSALKLDASGIVERVHAPLRPMVAAALSTEPGARPSAEQLVAELALQHGESRDPGDADRTRTYDITRPLGDGDRSAGPDRSDVSTAGPGRRNPRKRVLLAIGAVAVVVAGSVAAILLTTSKSGSTGAQAAERSPQPSAPATSSAATPISTGTTPPDAASAGTEAPAPAVTAFRPASTYSQLLALIPASVRASCTAVSPSAPSASEASCRIDLPNGNTENVIYSGYRTAADFANTSASSGDKVPNGCENGLSAFISKKQEGSYQNLYVDGKHSGSVNCQFVDRGSVANSYSNISWTDKSLSVGGFISNENGSEPAYETLYRDWLQIRRVE
jgi:serine/threonine protein kinase